MSGVKSASLQYTQYWQGSLSDYVTALAWLPDGDGLAVTSAAGEVMLQRSPEDVIFLQGSTDQAINGLDVSANGQYVAVGGQSGEVKVWDVSLSACPVTLQQHDGAWIDQLAWHPQQNVLAYAVGAQIHIWDVTQAMQVATLDFQASSVLRLAWHPQGILLAVSGHGGIKVWSQSDWSAAPKLIAVPGASLDAAWSVDGRYLGSGNLDRTLTVAEWDNSPPWLMQGFPGKVRQLAWSTPATASGSPLVAAACVEGITVWERGHKPKAGWRSRVLQYHKGRVNAIAFQPDSLTLASASEDGQIALWQAAQKPSQTLKGFKKGVTCLAWSVTGNRLAAGGAAGELQIWNVSHRAQGFG